LTANGYEGSFMLVLLVVACRLHMLPKRMVPKNAKTLKIGISKGESIEVLVSVRVAEAT